MVRDYSKAEIIKIIMDEANAQGVDPDIILAIAEHESGMRNNAISPKNNNGSRDHGVMQLNDKYHKLKNPYDPHENIRYGIKHFKGLLAGTGGDVARALSNYNAGAGATGKARQQGNNYARKVMALIPNFNEATIGSIARSNPKPQGNINDVQNNTTQGVDMSVNQPNITTNPYVTAQDLANAYNQITQSQDIQQLQKQATGADYQNQQARQLLNQYYSTNSISYPNLIQALASLGVSAEELRAIPPKDINADTQTRLSMLNQVGESPEQTVARRQDYINALQQMQTNQNQGRNIYDMLNQAYDQYRQDIQMPTGYSVDPRGLAAQALGSTMLANLGADPSKYTSYTDLRNAAYQAQVANQMGVPYDMFLKMREEQLALDKQRIADYLTAQGQIAPNDKAAYDAIAKMSQQDVDIIKERISQGGGILQQAEQNQGDIGEQVVSNQGSITTTGMTQAGQTLGDQLKFLSDRFNNATDLEKSRIAAEVGLSVSELDNLTKLRVADTQADVATKGQNLERQTAVDKINAERAVNQAKAGYYGSGTVLNLKAADPMLSTTGIAKTLNPNVRQQVFNPKLMPNKFESLINPNAANLQGQTGFDKLKARFDRPE